MFKTLILIGAIWFIREIKFILFWLFLWQLKEYHVGRFLDHFSTHKGKNIIFNYLLITKVILLVVSIIMGFGNSLLLVLFLIYSAETIIFLRQIYLKTVKKPVRTSKSLFLGGVSLLVVVLFLAWSINKNIVWLLWFDILTPIIVSAIVLLIQPFFVLARKNILEKAREKMEKLKLVSGLKVIAITGSYGKTSTKEFLTTILSKRFKVLSTSKHQNSEIGVARSILDDLKPSHQIFIAEVGAYNKGKVKEVCTMLKPRIGIVTGVNEQHLALFGSLENLLSAEGGGELAEALPKDGILVVNGDNKYCLDLYRKTDHVNKKIYSLDNKKIDSDIWSDSITVHKDGISFVVINKSGEMSHFESKVLGKHSVQNLLGAILIARTLGMSFEEISNACNDILQEQAGIVLKQNKHGINVIDSSYSANPDGVFADLDYFSIFEGKRVIVMPCLIELGDKSSMIHEKIGKKIGEICNLAIITSKDKFKEIKGGAMDAGMEEKDILLCDNPQDIYSIITLFCKSGDAVLLEGRVPQKLIDLLK